MSDCNDLIEVVRDRNEQIRMLQAQNAEWQQRYEALHEMYVGLIGRYQELFDDTKRAQ